MVIPRKTTPEPLLWHSKNNFTTNDKQIMFPDPNFQCQIPALNQLKANMNVSTRFEDWFVKIEINVSDWDDFKICIIWISQKKYVVLKIDLWRGVTVVPFHDSVGCQRLPYGLDVRSENVAVQVDVNARYFGTVIFYHKYRGYGFLGKKSQAKRVAKFLRSQATNPRFRSSQASSPICKESNMWISLQQRSLETRLDSVVIRYRYIVTPKKSQKGSSSHNLMNRSLISSLVSGAVAP
jgi:hypothetical protein